MRTVPDRGAFCVYVGKVSVKEKLCLELKAGKELHMFITPIQPVKGISKLEELNNVAEGSGSSSSALPFADVLQNAISGYSEAKAASDADNAALVLGDVNDLAQVQINSMKAESMLQTTVQLTTRMVNSYKEIMQMQV